MNKLNKIFIVCLLSTSHSFPMKKTRQQLKRSQYASSEQELANLPSNNVELHWRKEILLATLDGHYARDLINQWNDEMFQQYLLSSHAEEKIEYLAKRLQVMTTIDPKYKELYSRYAQEELEGIKKKLRKKRKSKK